MSVSKAIKGATDSIEVVDLALVNDDESWPTEAAKVEEFRAVIHQGKSFGTPVLWRTQDKHGRARYEIIDGFHRFRALVAEGVKQYPAMVRTGNGQDVILDRISASLDKPSPVLHTRAIAVLQMCVVQRLASLIADQPLMTIHRTKDGVDIAPRQGTFPQDPLVAVLVIMNHFVSLGWKRVQSGDPAAMSNAPVYPSYRERLEYLVRDGADVAKTAWENDVWLTLHDIARHFGDHGMEWLFSVLGLTLIGDYVSTSGDSDSYSTVSRIWLAVATLGDEELQVMLINRLRREHVSHEANRVAEALEFIARVGAHPTWASHRPFSRDEIRSLFASKTLVDLAYEIEKRKHQALEAERLQWLRVMNGVSTSATTETQEHISSESVFSVVGKSLVSTPGPEDPDRKALALEELYRRCNVQAQTLLRSWKELERKGGDWSRAQIQEDFRLLMSWIESHAE